ncbi:MAG: CHAD domain-containing protein [Noviherbaspirillum sp.]
MEIELKLLIDPAHAQALREHALLKKYASAAPLRQQMLTTYFDTPDLYFSRHRAALRVRQTDAGWVQTLKDGNEVLGGLHSRNEWEADVEESAPDLKALRELVGHGSPWFARLADENLQESLAPAFTSRIDRTAWLLDFPQGQQAELVLDQGELQRGEQQETISEIELELKAGDAAPLFDFALELQQDIALRLGNASKSARGYALMHPASAPLVKAEPLALDAAMRVEDALRAIAANCIGQMQGNEAGVMEGRDPEHVHQMRVGLRRLRSLLKLFEDTAPLPAGLDQELRWLGGELGAARDWEVLAGDTLSQLMHAQDGEPAFAPLQQAALAEAGTRRARASAAVGSVRCASLLLRLIAWLHGARWQRDAAPEQQDALDAPLKGFARRALKQGERRIERRAGKLAQADASARHRLRIAAKRMRYATEFFASLYPARRVRPYLKALSALQDSLGQLNDAAVARKALRELAARQPAQALGAGIAIGLLAAREQRALDRLCRRWKVLRRRPRPG